MPFCARWPRPLPEARFCPTGGITLASAPTYLALPNVGCIGGTWVTPPEVIADGDWIQRPKAGTSGQQPGSGVTQKRRALRDHGGSAGRARSEVDGVAQQPAV
jgi:2-dehydro-3-deoxyphosphogluconate aldolase/(4S)-4-hydroxy-2-oxoglutarate aldolase